MSTPMPSAVFKFPGQVVKTVGFGVLSKLSTVTIHFKSVLFLHFDLKQYFYIYGHIK